MIRQMLKLAVEAVKFEVKRFFAAPETATEPKPAPSPAPPTEKSLIDLAIARLGAEPETADGFTADAIATARAFRRSPVKTLRAIVQSLLEPMPDNWKPTPASGRP